MNDFSLSSKNDIIHNQQHILKRVKYLLKNMNACSDIGNERTKQEDSVLLLEHINNPNFRLLAVADGMGGLLLGGKASNLTLFEMIKWFERLPLSYYHNESKILAELGIKLHEIDLLVRKICGEGGTTLALAIVCEKNTLFVNIGDSRIYVHKGTYFEQISIDHSSSFDLYLKGQIIDKDDIRFHRRNHLINSRLGGLKKLLKIENIVLYNSEYDSTILVTDGISDCLPDNQLKSLVDNFENDIQLSEIIVDQAMKFNSTNIDLDLSEYYDKIVGGKDNATAAIFSKNMIFERNRRL